MAIKNTDVKTNILPHTQAKLDLFGGYLERYLRVLNHADFCKQINLFDIYCGAGLYDDGKKGSPLLAVDCIKKIDTEMLNKKKNVKPTSLSINDYNTQKIERVKDILSPQVFENCVIEYFNKNANEMLDIVAERISNYPMDHRNLVFIDPYGYSDINKDKIISLVEDKCTEIVLFLPVMQMYRFTEIALIDEDRPHYDNLRNFIISFYENPTKLKIGSIFEYIYSIKEALSMNGTYFTCSHYIERGKGSYYALFFIGSNIYGLEKMLETKWSLDPVKGKGFNQNENPSQLSMFDDEINEIDNLREISYLESIIYESLKNNVMTNIEIYELTLKNEFLPKHANSALTNLINKNKIREANNFTQFKINYTNYKNKTIFSKFEVV